MCAQFKLHQHPRPYSFSQASGIKLSLCNHVFRGGRQKYMKASVSLLLVLIFAFQLSPATAKVPPADLIFKNGNIYTVNDARPKAEAVAVKGDRIVFVGSNRRREVTWGRIRASSISVARRWCRE